MRFSRHFMPLFFLFGAASLAVASAPIPKATSAKRPIPSFAEYPTGRTITVQLPLIGSMSPDERIEQVRDWLTYAIVLRSGLSPREAGRALYDLPPVRRDYLRTWCNYTYGPARYRVLGDGRTVALIPAGDGPARLSLLGRIADDVVRDTGHRPKSIEVFTYSIDEEVATAELTHEEPIEATRIFTSDFGYVESTIRNAADLRRFLDSTNRICAAEVRDGALVLSGRLDGLRQEHPMTLDDVAALWKSEHAVEQQRQRVEAFIVKWASVERTPENEAKFEVEKKELLAQNDRGLSNGNGFSLDPAVDYDKLLKVVGKIKDLAKEMPEVLKFVKIAELSNIERDVRIHDESSYLELLDRLGHPADTLSEDDQAVQSALNLILEEERRLVSYQAARYDGTLRGTQVGMTLFYTDLTAKLWALNYDNSSPGDDNVAGFVSLADLSINSAYATNIEKMPATRLWFAPRAGSFQKVADGIRLGADTTRIYAASHNPLNPGKEAEPNAASAQFLNWWDQHYDAVAAFEPQYQRLDEIMKWSLVFGWLSERNAGSATAYLDSIDVDHGQWFPDWAAARGDLRFTNWSKIGFFPRDEAKTERLPLLVSDWYHQTTYMGGVSLGSRATTEARAVLDEATPRILRRANTKMTDPATGVIKTLDHVEFHLAATAKEASTVMTPPKVIRLRSAGVELKNAASKTVVETASNQARASAYVDGKAAALVAFDRRPNGLAVAFAREDLGSAETFITDLGEKNPDNLREWLASRSDVVAVAPAADDDFFVRLRGGSQWLRLSTEGTPRADIGSGVIMRAGSRSDQTAPTWTLAWADERTIDHQLSSAKYISIQPLSKQSRGVFIQGMPHGPPDGAERLDVLGPIIARRSGDEIFVERAGGHFPPLSRIEQTLVRPADIDLAVQMAVKNRALATQATAQVQRDIEAAVREVHPEAVPHLADLGLKLGPEEAETHLLEAMAEVEGGRIKAAVSALSSAQLTDQAREGMLATLLDAIGNPRLAEIDRDNLQQLAELIQGRAEQRTFNIASDKGRIRLEANLLDTVKRTKVDKPSGVGPVYIDADDPLFARSVNTDPKDAKLPDLEREFNQLTDQVIAVIQPETIVEPQTGKRYKLLLPTKLDTTDFRQVRLQCAQTSSTDTSDPADDEEVEKGPNVNCQGTVYLVSPAKTESHAVGSVSR